jgi:hypothetical protein
LSKIFEILQINNHYEVKILFYIPATANIYRSAQPNIKGIITETPLKGVGDETVLSKKRKA